MTANSSSMVNAYGGDIISVGSDGFVWSARLEIQLRGPAANEAGTVFSGWMKVGALS